MIPSKSSILALAGAVLLMSACSGLKNTSTSGGTGGTTGTYTIGGSVTGLTGTGLVLSDNATDTLTITPGTGGASVPFTFKTAVAGAYDVEVKTQPTAQTCTASANKGTATANVTTVAVACTTNPVTATIGGTISGLATGASVILQDNGGDSLTLTANGPFTFKTAVTGPTDAYAVTVNTQPATPNQICTVASGSGIATANVTNVAVTCVNSYSIGGNISGLVGTGLVLENSSDQELLTIKPGSGNQTFGFTNLVPTGTAYTVSISTQPSNPVQTCVITPSTASGTATANVTSVVITCPAVTYSIGGTVVGLGGVVNALSTPPIVNGPLTDNSFSLQDNLGNTQVITENGPFTFATPVALNDAYNISVFHGPSTQPQGCTRWGYKGVVSANVTDIVIDCAHNDWTWIDGTNTAGTIAKPQYGSLPSTAPTTTPNPFTNTPGARYGAVGWADSNGSLFLFGGDGWELSGATQPDTLDAAMNDLWVCDMSWGDYCQWQLVGSYDSTAVTVNGKATTVGAQIIANAQHELQNGLYPGTPLAPPARLGAAAWTDSSGNFWLFGGSNGNNFMNDLWMYNHSSLSPSTYTTTEGTWTFEAGSTLLDQSGNYSSGTLTPGARTNPVTWTDGSGNLWLFGGYGYDGKGTLGLLNDLWEYTGGKWAFVSGGNTDVANQNSNYGLQGMAASSNMPGGRQEAVGWADANGNLWLFGGEGLDDVGTPNGILNDLWVYNIASKEWTWVIGAEPIANSTRANHTGVYPSQSAVGPVNTTAAANTCGLSSGLTLMGQTICSPIDTTGALPGSRWGAAAWVDVGGNFWLFGGWGLDAKATNGNGALNDTWVYTPNAVAGQPGTWTWVKGSNTGSDNGAYGTLTRPYLTYEIWTPGGRSGATYWVDRLHTLSLSISYNENNQLWLFGGEGYDSTSTNGNGYLNDLWRYLPYRDY
jgi:Galactose oxidase, central domain